MESIPVAPPHLAGPLRLAPFRALRLASGRVGDPSAARLFGRPHRRARSRVADWERRGYLVHDTAPAIYLHEFTRGGATVRGVVGALDVTARAVPARQCAVLPHEGVYPAQADDLATTMATLELEASPLLLVHRAPAGLRELLWQLRRRPPLHQFVDRDGEPHRIWAVREPADQTELARRLEPCTALLADGHHRYAAHLRLQRRHPAPASDGRALAMLVDQDDTPLHLGAIHRLLVGSGVDDVEAAAADLGLRTEPAPADSLHVPERTLLVGDRSRAFRLSLDPDDAPRAVTGLETGPHLLMADLLHDQVVPGLPRGPSRITYHHAADGAWSEAEPGQATAVLLPAPTFDEVVALAVRHRLFPRKTTSFQPKPKPAVIFRRWHDG